MYNVLSSFFLFRFPNFTLININFCHVVFVQFNINTPFISMYASFCFSIIAPLFSILAIVPFFYTSLFCNNITECSINMKMLVFFPAKCVRTAVKTMVVDRKNQKALALLYLALKPLQNVANSSCVPTKFATELSRQI